MMSSSAGLTDPSDGRPVASPSRRPTLMTRDGIAQIGENRNPKSPGNRAQTHRFLRNRLLQTRHSAAPLNGWPFFTGDSKKEPRRRQRGSKSRLSDFSAARHDPSDQVVSASEPEQQVDGPWTQELKGGANKLVVCRPIRTISGRDSAWLEQEGDHGREE